MPGIVWQNLDPVTMSRLGVDLIREELARRQLDITGSKEELFQRLQADIQQQREATPSVETNESASTAAAPLTLDPATLQSLAMLFQQLPRPATTVTTLPDLSSSIPQFAGLHSHSVNTWLDDVRRVQQLASWDDATTRLIAASKLKGTARDWHLAFGNQYSTWATWSAALKDTFCAELSLIEWQEQVMRVTQAPSESLHQYAFAKLKIIERCPVHLSEAQKIDYLLHGLREQHILAAIAANRPPTVAEFISTCTSLDKSAQHLHAKASPSPFAISVLPPTQPFRAAKPAERQQPRSEQSTPQSSRGATPKTRISELPTEQQEATYAAISAQYGAPAFRSGQDLSQAVCYQCHALGHLASKCPTRTSRLSSSAPPTMPKTQQPPALHSAPVTLDGSQQQCPFFNATLSGVGECEAFPDSGSKVTLISKTLVPASMIIPWTEPPLVVVGGSTVLPVGAAFLKISIGPATGVVEAAVLEDNVLPLILGEDWFSAAQARLIFEPPKPTQLQHTATNSTITANQKLGPRMANAVIPTRSVLFPETRPSSKDCLQRQLRPRPLRQRPRHQSPPCQRPRHQSPPRQRPRHQSPPCQPPRHQSRPRKRRPRQRPRHQFPPRQLPRRQSPQRHRQLQQSPPRQRQPRQRPPHRSPQRQHKLRQSPLRQWPRRRHPLLPRQQQRKARLLVYRLIEQLTPSTFRASCVSCLTSRLVNQPRTVHVSQLKPYVPPVSPVIEQQPAVNAEPTPASEAIDQGTWSGRLGWDVSARMCRLSYH
ncbi:uncharacterized protein LOC125758148 [Rhipicephalus sanguineus]|uniref:uncharacterized protein LOC125758148 n=1 Tax=Rhipicephalus sanguineus TaxID=34632 RepID=UPI0020C4FA05|nr:uncharacterized protein LOC125758148 [Rhipicephalus sanguineus]